MTTADAHTLTGAYATDALTPDEREAFEHHLRACPSCAHEVQELQETVARLGAAAAVTVPARLHEQVMGAVSRTRQMSPLVRTADGAAARRRGVLPRVWIVTAAASLALATAGLGAVAAELYWDLQQTRHHTDQVNAVLTAPDAQTATASSGTGPRGTVVVSRQQGRLVFLPAALPHVPPTRTYQLWLLGPGTPRSAGLLRPEEPTRPVITQASRGINAVGVTVEPAGGSRRPTTQPILVVRLPRA